jgi:hypothetical protein
MSEELLQDVLGRLVAVERIAAIEGGGERIVIVHPLARTSTQKHEDVDIKNVAQRQYTAIYLFIYFFIFFL